MQVRINLGSQCESVIRLADLYHRAIGRDNPTTVDHLRSVATLAIVGELARIEQHMAEEGITDLASLQRRMVEWR